MFDLGTSAELLIIALAVLILLGPKEIPTVLRFLGRIVYKFRSLTAGIRAEYAKYLQEGEFDAYQQSINSAIKAPQDRPVDKQEGKQQDKQEDQEPEPAPSAQKASALQVENRAPTSTKD
jgi:Sec-independent protein secretion pathway components